MSPQQWMELSVRAPGEYAEALSSLFSRHADGGVAIEEAGGYNPDEGEAGPAPGSDVTLRAFLLVDDSFDDRRAQIDVGVRLVSHLHRLPPLRETRLDEAAWRQQRFEPVRVGERILVAPAGARAARRPGDVVIPLTPGLAFGTGHHPTTRMCLALLERLMTPRARVLDLGCGSGILSIAALLLGARSATALDIDDDAVSASRANLELAGVGGHATVAGGTLPHAAAAPGAFDIALTNISAKVLRDLSMAVLRCLAPGGRLIGSGYLLERRDEVEAAVAAAGGEITERAIAEDWCAFVAHRRAG